MVLIFLVKLNEICAPAPNSDNKLLMPFGVNGEKITRLVDATVGRIIFNEKIPQDLGFADRSTPEKALDYEVMFPVDKKMLGKIIDATIKIHGITDTATLLDNVKAMGFKYSTRGAITVSVSDMEIPGSKQEYLDEAEKEIEGVVKKFNHGLLSDEERYKRVINIWTETSNKITQALMDNLDELNPIFMMANSGARGSNSQIKQLAGMRGLMADTSGRIIELPIKSNFREGLDVLEYFMSAHGARKGLSDTALRTATRSFPDLIHGK